MVSCYRWIYTAFTLRKLCGLARPLEGIEHGYAVYAIDYTLSAGATLVAMLALTGDHRWPELEDLGTGWRASPATLTSAWTGSPRQPLA